MYMKVHKNNGNKIVAVCDKDLIGRVLEADGAFMDLDSFRGFYVGSITDPKDVEAELNDFSSANLVGKNAVDVAINMKIAQKSELNYINSVPYIQLYKI
jgi:hypothetical protein